MKKLVFFGIIVLIISGTCFGQGKTATIEGAWKIVEYSFNSTDTSWTNTSPQPGLFIFGREYYSMMYISGNQSRPLMDKYETRYTLTDEQIRSCFMRFVGNSGKYKLVGSKLTTSAMVALIPNFMAGDDGWELDYKFKGNTMQWHRELSDGFITYKFRRLE